MRGGGENMEQAGKEYDPSWCAARQRSRSACPRLQPRSRMCRFRRYPAGRGRYRARASAPTLIVMQSDAPDVQDLHRCAELAERAEAVFLLLVRQEAYGAAWRTLQKHGVCVMTWPMEQAVLTQTLRNLLLLKKACRPGPDRPAALTAAGSQTHPEGKRASHASARHDGAGRAPLD